MMVQTTPFIVCVLLSTLSCCSAENVYCVTSTQPTDTSCSLCPRNSIHCATLLEYAQQAKSYFTSNTTMVLLPGDHTLDMNITVANISRLTMCGETSSGYETTVICNGSVGLGFIGMVDLKILSLSFTSCGRTFDKHAPNFDKYSLLLESIKYAKLVNCSFHDNLGTALAVYNAIILAENNEFTHNHCGGEGSIPSYCIGGRGITAMNSNLTFIGNTTFLQNQAMFCSAGIYMINCSLSSNGSIHFINNSLTAPHSSESSGVAIWALASSLNITGTSNFINNSADLGGGGAIVAVDNTSLSFTGTNNFINNYAYYKGGAILAYHNTSVCFTGTSNFINNSAESEGGAIAAEDHTSVNFTGTSNFINNSAHHGGAVAAIYHTSLSFTGTSNFINNSAHHGGAVAAIYHTSLSFTGTSNFINNLAHHGGAVAAEEHTSVSFTGTSNFLNNLAHHGGAIAAEEHTSLSFTGTSNFINNSADIEGGAIAAEYHTFLSFTGTSNFINNSAEDSVGGAIAAEDHISLTFTGTGNFVHNSAYSGGAIFAWPNTSLSFTGTGHFINNSAVDYGGAIGAKDDTSLSFTGTNKFIKNSADHLGGAIAAFSNTSLCFIGISNFINNSAGGDGGAIYVLAVIQSVSFTGSTNFINNSAHFGGAIIVFDSTSLSFTGTSNFINNSAKYLGGGVLLQNSTFSISSNTTVYWESNHARLGGAIYTEDGDNIDPLVYCTQLDTCAKKGECFFQLLGQNLSNGIDAQLVFKDNSADAGSVLYGGAIDYCKLTGLELYSSGEVFDMLVRIQNDNMNSSISSEPFRICPCENNKPDCSQSLKSYTVHPGETFQISVVTVGQRNGTVPKTVRGRLTWHYSSTPPGNLLPFQYVQATFNTCTMLNYTVFSLLDKIHLELYADGPCSTFSNELNLKLDLNQTCPPGFNLSDIKQSCVCNQRLAKYTNDCDITNGLGRITRNSSDKFWVGYENESHVLILHPHCPFDYCVSHTVDFPLNNTDMQCAYNRSGLLCGACKKGYSLMLGTSQCKQCTNIHLVLLIPFALMGLALVFFLLVSKLTVATGTLSGLVFYANIVGVNRTTFIPVESTDTLSVFIAWLNLDFGIETCFYNGMDAYSKAWLQFVFPLYIWVLIGLIILASHFSHRFTKLLGNNPVSVLATLILLSYTKILRNLIAAIYITYLEYPTYNRGVWLYDANIDYFSIKHIPLFVLAILVFLFLFVPYTLLLLFGQWLQAISHLRLLGWVNSARLKFFMDSYHAPYKAKHHYWPGLLLVFRFILLLVFAINPQQDPSINLLAILVGTAALQLWAWTSGGVYKNSSLDALEGSFALNLIILVGSNMCVNYSGGERLAFGYTSITIALVTFIGILAFQLADVTGITPCLKKKHTDMKRYVMANRHSSRAEAEVGSESDTDSLPDRLINPNEYERLSFTAQEHRVAEPIEAVNEERRLIPVYTYGSIN